MSVSFYMSVTCFSLQHKHVVQRRQPQTALGMLSTDSTPQGSSQAVLGATSATLPMLQGGHLTCYFSIVGFGTLLLIARGHMLTLWQWLIRTLAISTWCITPREPLHRGCAAVPWSRARVRLLERACEGGWGKPSSARRCRSAGWPERKRYSSRCLSPPPPSVASDLMLSSLLSSLQ